MRKIRIVFQVAKDYWDMIKRTFKKGTPTYVLVRCASAEHAGWLASELKDIEGVHWVVINPPEIPKE